MSDTQCCTHTGDGTICAACLGRTKPAPWVRARLMRGFVRDVIMLPVDEGMIPADPERDFYLASDVEQWAKEVKTQLKNLQDALVEINPNNHDHEDTIRQNNSVIEAWEIAQHLLAHWPVKEDQV